MGENEEEMPLSPTECYPRKFGNYSVIKKISRGAFSVVCLMKNDKTGQEFAGKIISRKILEEKETITHLEQELRLQQSLQNENICQLYDIIYEKNYICVILEYCKNGELFEFIIQNQRLHVGVVKKLFAQLVSAVSYLHSKNIAHRDLKPENVFLDENFNAKLGDFGFCHSVKEETLLSTACGSVYYVAPEVIRGEQYDGKKSDIWSLGVLLFVMATGSLPWTEQNQARLYSQIENAEYKIPGFVPREAQEIIRSCMQISPSDRPTAADLLQTHYVKSSLEAQEAKTLDEQTHAFSTCSVAVLKKKRIIVRPTVSKSTRVQFTNSVPQMMKKKMVQYPKTSAEAPQ